VGGGIVRSPIWSRIGPSIMGHFQNAVAIVTGGASGLGRSLSEELGRRGAVVAVTDIDEAGARQVASGIVVAGGRAAGVGLDVRDAEAVRSTFESVAAAHGRLDFVFNNAGVAVSGEVQSFTLEHWRRILDVNLLGVIHSAAAAYALMARQGSGHIVNTASLAGLVGFPSATPYATTKFGVVGLSLSMRAEGKDLGVKVSALCPAFIQTGIFDASTYVGSRKEDVLAAIPFRIISPAEAVGPILRGVERKQAVIVLPFYARFFWWLFRIHPGLAGLLGLKTIRDFRRIRGKGLEKAS
jgi:NAD(P)-dependent dehydrogenase (short-subunit alcohol dehydrogenase family)